MSDFVEVAKALGDANRVAALVFLRQGEQCVCRIIELLGLAPSTVSKHMSILRQAGLVTARREGRWTYYALAGRKADPVVRGALRWLDSSVKDAVKSQGKLSRQCIKGK